MTPSYEFLESIYKCSKEDPNNARNEETENRSVEMSMRTPIKVTVAGDPAARARQGQGRPRLHDCVPWLEEKKRLRF